MAERLDCRSYTTARRFPRRIGDFQGWSLPVPLTVPQLMVGLVTFLVMLLFHGVWARGGVVVNTFVLLGVTGSVAWSARRSRIEGRAAWRFALGVLSLWFAQLVEAVDREPRPVRVRARVLFEQEGG